MSLLLWVLFCLVVCALLTKRPHLTVLFALGVWIAIPSVAGELLVGGGPRLHPGLWSLVTAFVALAFGKRRIIAKGLGGSIGTVAILVLFIVYGVFLTMTLRSDYATVGFINTFGSAFIAFILVRGVIASDPQGVQRLVRGMLFFAVLEACLAFAQAASGTAILFAAQREQFYWFNTTGAASRATGTLDSPLDLALFLVVCIPLTAQVKRPPLRFTLALVLAAAVALSQSRVGAALAVAGLLYLVLRSRMNLGVRLFMTGSIGAVMAYFIFVPNPVTSRLFDRIEGSTGSTLARSTASDLYFSQIWEQPVTGTGYTSNGIFQATGQLRTSLENAYFMVSWDFGIFAVLLGIALIVAFLRGAFGGAARGTIAAFAFGLVAAGSYSGPATQSAALVVLLVVVGLAAPAVRVARAETTEIAKAAKPAAPTHSRTPIAVAR